MCGDHHGSYTVRPNLVPFCRNGDNTENEETGTPSDDEDEGTEAETEEWETEESHEEEDWDEEEDWQEEEEAWDEALEAAEVQLAEAQLENEALRSQLDGRDDARFDSLLRTISAEGGHSPHTGSSAADTSLARTEV
eukprot:COSAG01_NODE_10819_length_2074_cov_1.647089_2_plen_137_part_00